MSLFPRNINFFKMFESQAEHISKANQLLQQITKLEHPTNEINELRETEHSADRATHEIFRTLNQTFITPIEREDIIGLASCLDDVVDAIERAVILIDLYKVSPKLKEIGQLAKLIDKSAAEISKAIHALPQLHKSYHEIMKHCELINYVENQVDDLSNELIGELVNNEKDAVKIIKLKEIYESFEDIADRGEDVAHALETIVVKNQ